jgi:hypothetical protein
MEQQQIVTSVHHENGKNFSKAKRSSSASSSSSSGSTQPGKASNAPPKPNQNSNIHRSFESLQQTYENEEELRPPNKTGSLEFGTRPVQYDDPC